MKLKSLTFGIALVALMSVTAAAQTRKPVVFSTLQKVAIGTLADGYEVRGKATFTITAANSDDSIAGTLTYVIPEDARQKVAVAAGKQISAVPTTFAVKNVVSTFQKTTACPTIHIELGPMEIDAAGAKIKFPRKVVLDIQGQEPGSIAKPTPQQEMAMQFCVWTKQINNGGIRRGVIRRVNELINGGEEQ